MMSIDSLRMGYLSSSVTASNLFSAITSLAEASYQRAVALKKDYARQSKEHGPARTAYERLDPDSPLSELFCAAQISCRIAAEMDYILKTRASLLSADQVLTVSMPPRQIAVLECLLHDKEGLLDELGSSRLLTVGIIASTDALIPRARIHKAATVYYNSDRYREMVELQISDDVMKVATIKVLATSHFGRKLIAAAKEQNYAISFIDFNALNICHHDMKSVTPDGFYRSPRFIYFSSNDFFDDVYRAVKLAHEIGHGLQEHTHLCVDKYKDDKLDSFYANVRQYAGMREAHSIACEYVVGAELIQAGMDKSSIREALAIIPNEVIALLAKNPADFIKVMGTSDYVRSRWHFTQQEINFSASIARNFATSLPTIPVNQLQPLIDTMSDEAREYMEHAVQRILQRNVAAAIRKFPLG